MSAIVKTISQDHFTDRLGNEWCITTKATTIEQGTVYTVHSCDLSAEDAETDEGYSETFATAEQATTIEQGTVYTVHFCDLSADDADGDEGYSETFSTAEQATTAVTDFRNARSTSGGITMTNSNTNDTAGKIKYMVECQEYTLVGIDGKINDDACNCDPDDLGAYDSLDDAIRSVNQLSTGDYHQIVVNDTRHGVGSITRNVFTIDRIALDEDGDWQLCDEDGNTNLAFYPEHAKVIDVLDWYPTVRETFERCVCKDYTTISSAMQVHAEEVGTLDNVDPCPIFYRCHSGMLGTFSAICYDDPADITRVDDVNIAGGLDDIVPCDATEDQLVDAIENGEWWGDNDATSPEDWLILKLVADAI